MIESQVEVRNSISQEFAKYKERLPGVGRLYVEMSDEVYKEGAVSTKNKRLMALTGALVHGCQGCILFQAENALEAGASVEEILEAAAVAISLGGTMAAGETCRLVRFLEERGEM